MLKQGFSLSQKQRLSPIQFQTIKMLEHSNLEIEELINKELEDNPALENIEIIDEDLNKDSEEEADGFDKFETTDNSNLGLSDDMDIMESYNNSQDNSFVITSTAKNADAKNEFVAQSEQSFIDSLSAQINDIQADELTLNLAKYIVGNINSSGYLTRSVDEMVDDLTFSVGIDVSPLDVEKSLKLVQGLDPAGIGARNLQECLDIQICRKQTSPSVERAKTIIRNYFDKFTQKKYTWLAKKLKIDQHQLNEAIDEILKLSPKPGGEIDFKYEDILSRIVPDFLVEQYDEDLYVSLNNLRSINLAVDSSYVGMITKLSKSRKLDRETQKGITFAKQKVGAAYNFIEALKQRNNTMIRTMTEIANKQKKFFFSGDESDIKPLRLKDIADSTGYDISTISRVTNSKYVQTQYGVFLLKFFFSESFTTIDGQSISSKKIKTMITDIISKEETSTPLTDDEIVAKLQKEGVGLARRTVAKYRQQLNIPSTRSRYSKKNNSTK